MTLDKTSTKTLQITIVDAPICTVTVLEDRALVQRKGKVNLTSGLWRICVEKVAPVISDKSLRAQFGTKNQNSSINDVRLRRRMLVKEAEKPEEIEYLLAEYRKFVNLFEEISEDRQYQEKNFQELRSISDKTIEEIPIDAVWGQLDPSNWRSQFQTLFQKLRETQNEILSSYTQEEELAEKINYLIERIKASYRPDLVYIASIEADLAIANEGEYELIFDYIVPNALWRPEHQARLLTGEESKLDFRCGGCVWQRTGEDWDNVDLVFSTARASLGTEPPILTDDRLKVKDKSEEIIVEAREQEIQTAGLGTGDIPSQQPETVNLPGVDDGGEVRQLRASVKATVPSDGLPYRVPLFSFESPAEIEYVLIPEIATEVILKSQQINLASHPLLAAPVDLIRSSEFIGKTSILFIAPREKFALGWGADAALRVQRTQESQQVENHLTKWNIYTFTTKIFLSNIGAEPKVIKIIERVPVSEIEQVKVEVIRDKTTDEVQPDENGFCIWNVTLEAYCQKVVTLLHKIEAAPEISNVVKFDRQLP